MPLATRGLRRNECGYVFDPPSGEAVETVAKPYLLFIGEAAIIGNVADPGVWSHVHDEGFRLWEQFCRSRPLGVRLRRAQNAIKREPQAVGPGRWVAFAANHSTLPAVDEKRG